MTATWPPWPSTPWCSRSTRAADGRYTFLLDATPLPLTGALGSPVNPIALR
jgi:hypothetical protein